VIITKKKTVNVETDNGGPVFFSDTVTVSHNQNKFVLDFQQMTPRFSKIGAELEHKMFLAHKTVMLDPGVAKDLSRILTVNVENYEKKFGKIEIKRIESPVIKKDEKMEYTGYIG